MFDKLFTFDFEVMQSAYAHRTIYILRVGNGQRYVSVKHEADVNYLREAAAVEAVWEARRVLAEQMIQKLIEWRDTPPKLAPQTHYAGPIYMPEKF